MKFCKFHAIYITKSFTLIELLVVISIIGLLSSIVLASLNSARAKGVLAAGQLSNSNIYHSLGDSLVFQVDFDECSSCSTATDFSGNGYVGSLLGGAGRTTSTYNGNGYALSLNGSGSYVEFGSLPTTNFSGSTMTYTMWIYPTAEGGLIYRPIISMRNACSSASFQLHLQATTGQLAWWGGSTYVTNFNPPLNSWTFIAVTLDPSNNLSIYINGSFLANTTIPARDTSNSDLRIGTDGTCGNYFSGAIDETRIYTRTLTSSEIGKLYASEAPRFKNLAEKTQ